MSTAEAGAAGPAASDSTGDADAPTPRVPIVVLGANHTGTRLIVEILEALGSDAGASANPFREEQTFLDLHMELIDRVSDAGWLGTIFDPAFAASFVDDGRWTGLVRERLAGRYGPRLAPDHGDAWHWKCPTSLYFLPTWLRVFPEARFIHVERDAIDVAGSFLRRGEVRRVSDGVALYHLMNDRIRDASSDMKHYWRIRLEAVEEGLDDLARAAGLTPFADRIGAARARIRESAPARRRSRRTPGEMIRAWGQGARRAAYRWTRLSWF